MSDDDSERNIRLFMEQQIPFNRFLGIRVAVARDGFARFELPFREELVGDPFRPALHGGVLSTLIDTCGGCAVFTAARDEDRVSTVDLRVDFLRPGPLQDLGCEARVLRIGNRVGVTEMRAFPLSDEERVIASGMGVYNVRRHP